MLTLPLHIKKLQNSLTLNIFIKSTIKIQIQVKGIRYKTVCYTFIRIKKNKKERLQIHKNEMLRSINHSLKITLV